MSKLYFRYGAMNSGKSTALLQAAYNYEERGQRVLLAKPAVDLKGENTIVSRLGMTREVDLVVVPEQNLRQVFAAACKQVETESGAQIACLLLDEAQFFTRDQINQALEIAVLDGVPVLAYGIRTDFLTNGFPGSLRLLEVAHSLEELKTICRCGRKAMFNARKVDDKFVFDGEQVAIDGFEVTYESLCPSCYFREKSK
ncbi:MAG: thymidine kinase [Micrococcales bacterium]